MDKKYLLESASRLQQADEAAAAEYIRKSEQLIVKMNAFMQERSDIESLIGVGNITMMKDNTSNHVRFIGSILKNYNAEVLVNTVLWVFRAYRSHGFRTTYWAAQLKTSLIVLNEELSAESFKAVYPLYDWMQVNIPQFVRISEACLESSNSVSLKC